MIEEGGKIILILGPMFSGKTTTMINKVQKYKYKKRNTILIKYSKDNRYDEEEVIVTHEQEKYNATKCAKLSDIYDSVLTKYDVIGIDEGQFFNDLVPICEKLCNIGKIVVVAALSGNFKMEPFQNVSYLISKADKIKLLKAYCHFCKKSAGFSLRTVKCEQEILIGSKEFYLPVCKSCYYSHYIGNSQTYDDKRKDNEINNNISSTDTNIKCDPETISSSPDGSV